MSEFTLSIDKFIKAAPARASEVVRKVSTELLTSIVLKTPVDTGRARASWGVGLNRVDPAVSITLVDKDGHQTIAKGMASINQWELGDDVVIASNLPYIGMLEYGHSRQAPLGMVRTSIAEFGAFVDAAVRSLPKEPQ